jgi:hypothetical protein
MCSSGEAIHHVFIHMFAALLERNVFRNRLYLHSIFFFGEDRTANDWNIIYNDYILFFCLAGSCFVSCNIFLFFIP